jgi:hypothetical protein
MLLQFNACYTLKDAGPARPPDNERLSLHACGEETATKKEGTTREMKKDGARVRDVGLLI